MATPTLTAPGTGETATAALDAGSDGQGLAKGSISLSGVLFVSIATMAPGAGAAYAIMTGAGFAGGGLPLAVLGALIGCVLVAFAISQISKHMSSAGGLGSFVGRAVHPGLGFVVAWGAPAFYLAALPYLSLIFGNMIASSIFPSGGSGYTATWIVGSLGCLLLAGAMNYFGASFGSKMGVILGSVEFIVLIVMAVHMIVSSGSSNSADVFTTKHSNIEGFTGMSGVIAASVYGFMAFIGFEAAAPLAAETKNPKRNIPRAIVGSSLIVGIFYLLTTYAATTYFGADKMGDFMAFNDGNAWLGMAKHLWGAGWIVLLITLLNSSVACSNGAAMAGTRSIWAMGHAGTIPKIFAKTHAKWKSPVTAIFFMFGVAAVLTVAGGLFWDPVTAGNLYGTLIAVIALPVHILAALACPVYYLRYRRSEFNIVFHGLVPVLGAAFLVPGFFAGAGIPVFSFVAPLSWPLNLAGPITLGVYVAALAVMAYLMARKPDALQILSDHDHTAEDPIEVPARHAVLPALGEEPVPALG